MNRRSFIGTLTALAGVVLAKIKAPAAELRPRGVAMLTRCPWCDKATSEFVQWTAQGTDGFYHSAAICRQCFDRKTRGDTCPRCGTEPMPGYDTLCMNRGDCPMMDTYHIAKWRQLGNTRSLIALQEYYRQYGKFPY